MMFLDGKVDTILKMIDEEMKKASKELNFEKAAELRDEKISIENLMTRQKVDNFTENDIDVIGIAKSLDKASLEVFHIRGSKMIGGENFIFKDVDDLSDETLITNFIKQYYNESNVPSKIMFKNELEEGELLREFLIKISGKQNIEFKIPKKGEKMRFIEMAEKNAMIGLKNKTDTIENEGLLVDLMNLLELKELPKRIESFDISNISGTDIVAGMVVFENAKPKRSDYRRIKIKTVDGQNDVACMRETLMRRLKYLLPNQTEEKNPYGPRPNLILMDGGITQVRVAKNVVREYGLDIPVYGLVKNDKHRTRTIVDEEGKEYEVKSSEIFNLITYIQDEVHETAIEYHRKLRNKRMKKSELDEIEGIGDARKQALLKRFKSIENIKKASVAELCLVDGINEKIAEKILEKLN